MNQIKSRKLIFVDESNWLLRTVYFVMSLFYAPVFSYMLPPVVFGDRAKWVKTPSLVFLGDIIGFDTSNEAIFAYHQRRLRYRVWTAAGFFIIFVAILFPLILIGLTWLVSITNPVTNYLISISLISSSANRTVGTIIFIIISILFAVVFSSLFFRIATALTDQYFADTLCIYSVIYLGIELSRDDVLLRSDRKRASQKRIDNLAEKTALLSRRFSSKDDSNQQWLKEHFNHISKYIRDRELWNISSKNTTLTDLRRDFRDLANVYVTGQYGTFSWPAVIPKAEQEKMSWFQRILKGLPRFLGIAIPLIIMGYLLFKPENLQPFGLEPSVIALIFIAWLLIAIDITLKLGIIAALVGVAKGIKELK